MNVENRNGQIVEEVQAVSCTSDQLKELNDHYKNQPMIQKENLALEPSLTDPQDEINTYLNTGSKDDLGDSLVPARNASSDRSETCNVAIMRRLEDTVSVHPLLKSSNLFEIFSCQLLFKTFQSVLDQSSASYACYSNWLSGSLRLDLSIKFVHYHEHHKIVCSK